MAKVYALADELTKHLPVIDYKNLNFKKEMLAEEKFIKVAQKWANARNPKDTLAGERYAIGHGDGAAQYIVLSSKPVQLMHLPIGDGWDSPWSDKVTKKDLVDEIKLQKSLEGLFDKL